MPSNWKTTWNTYSFVDLSVEILSLYISPEELSKEDLRDLVERSYKTFRHQDVTPLVRLGDRKFVLELFHGPTFAFKDVALQLLGNLFEFFLRRKNARRAAGKEPEKLTVVGATSGDTGRYVMIIQLIAGVYKYQYLIAQLFMASEANLMCPSSSFIQKVASRQSRRHK